MKLSGKTALVTGASRGLGRACALRFAAEGADLILFDVAAAIPGVPYPLGTRAQLDHTAELCTKSGASVQAQAVDVRDSEKIRQATEAALQRFGRIDILVNNAGVAAPSGKIAHDIEEDEWQLMLDIDLSGAWRMIRAVGPQMTSQRSGSIVNIASTAGLVGYRHFAAYVAAKHGLVGLSRAVALDYAPHMVRVNAICPGSVRDAPQVEGRMLSEIARCLDLSVSDHEETFLQAQPNNALVEPEDVASAALWLASDETIRVTGSVVTVDGGFTVR